MPNMGATLLSKENRKKLPGCKKGWRDVKRMVETARPTDPKKRRPEEEVVRRKEGTRISGGGGKENRK